MKKTDPMKVISAPEIAKHFFNSSEFRYCPLEEIIDDNDGCFTSKYFPELYRTVNFHNSFTEACHLEIHLQVERYNRIIFVALRTYGAGHTHVWVMYKDALT